jgi:metallo-beta-lactamase family protein
MQLTFQGGVDTVTGSRHLLTINGHRVLRDCGLYQGRREEADKVNRAFDFNPAQLDAVLLSHAHIDHCGNLPSLARAGFRGPIHATTATVALCDVMLRDAARIQEQDAAYLNQKTNRAGMPRVDPLYTTADVDRVMPLFRGHSYHKRLEIVPGLSVESLEAGHILGAALHVATLEEGGRTARVGFAIDLGRHELPLIRDPDPMENIDVLVIESTYGARFHDPVRDAEEQLGRAVKSTLDRGGKVLIPSFALERAQEVLYHLSRLMHDGQLPRIPVFVDSPMATAVTRIFEKSGSYLDDEFRSSRKAMGLVMMASNVRFISSVEESKRVTSSADSCIVIAGSGMCEHGRILHHLKHGIEDERNSIVLVGYQAEHTLGRRLADGETKVRIFGDWFERRATVVKLDAFSAHADRDDLIRYVREARPGKVCLVHGEPEAREALAAALTVPGGPPVLQPKPGDEIPLG